MLLGLSRGPGGPGSVKKQKKEKIYTHIYIYIFRPVGVELCKSH